jgi:hypothetical protein
MASSSNQKLPHLLQKLFCIYPQGLQKFDGILSIHPKMNPTAMFNISSKNGKIKGYFLFALFSFIKFTIFFNFPFFLGTTTIGDNHVASSIG